MAPRYVALAAAIVAAASVATLACAEETERKGIAAPPGHVFKTIISGYEFRSKETRALQDDDREKVAAAIEDVLIYPNPVNGKFNFGLPGDFPSNCVWKISDQRGVVVKSGNFDDSVNGIKTVDVSSFTNGVYFVAIGAAGGNSVYRKLVVLNTN